MTGMPRPGLRLGRTVVALLLVVFAAGPALADGPVAPFLGTYVGSATVFDHSGTAVEQRDLDITISEGQRGAFTVTWVNVTLVDGRRDVPGVQRRVDQVTMMPGDRPGIYVEEVRRSLFETRRRMDPMGGEPLRWAAITNGRLGNYVLMINPDGTYELQAYERVLTEHGLDIDYRRILDGVVERRITGRTIRVD